MNKTYRAIIVLVLYLAVVFNLERLATGELSMSAPQFLFFGVIILAIVSVFFIPAFRSGHISISLLLWLGIYLSIRLLFSGQRPLLGGMNTYITLTEMTLLALAIIVSRELARRLQDIENIIEMITFADLQQRVTPYESAVDEIGNELMRSRRHHRPLSVLVFKSTDAIPKADLSATLKEIQNAMLARYVTASLAKIISAATRRIDMILEQNGKNNRFIIICPETTAEGSQVVAKRIQEAAQEQVGISVSFGKATFPEEGMTFEDLLHKAEKSMAVLEASEAPTTQAECKAASTSSKQQQEYST